jgi:hypothetical protein
LLFGIFEDFFHVFDRLIAAIADDSAQIATARLLASVAALAHDLQRVLFVSLVHPALLPTRRLAVTLTGLYREFIRVMKTCLIRYLRVQYDSLLPQKKRSP